MNLYKLIYFILAVIFAKCKSTMRVVSATPSAIFTRYPATTTTCGGILTERHGIIQTPNFPNPFHTPISCVWIIDASSSSWGTPNVSINVYLTQQYVLSGLTFKEYMYYSDDFKVPSEMETVVKEENITRTASVQANSPFLEISFHLDNLYGTHLRVMDHLLDVYGFNITYEIDTPKAYQCNSQLCSFLGNCYASSNFTSYRCHCHDGFTGEDCCIGPRCADKKYCENGGVCKHVGDLNVKCLCPYGFRGNKCETHEFLNDDHECNLSKDSTTPDDSIDYKTCSSKCLNDLGNLELCSCHQNNEIGRGQIRFEVTLRLGNASILMSTSDGRKKLNQHSVALLEKYISRFLRNSNMSKINDLEIISKTSSENDLTFHFFGAENDSIKLREAINRMVERGRIGNFSLVSSYYGLQQEPGLVLQSLESEQKLPLRERENLVLICTAYGSSETEFRWYKNGYFLNISRSMIGKISILREVEESDNKIISTLILNATEQYDSGHYTCKAIDWGLEICKTIKVDILVPPSIRLEPPSVTLFRGESMRIRCIASQSNPIKERLGYSWTKNNALFHSDVQFEMWEELYPEGSILTIQNIHKSATYACSISNSFAPVSASIHVNIVDLELMSICQENMSYGIKWPASSSGPSVLFDCPFEYNGMASRYCEQRDYNRSEWLQPDFSDCINQKLLKISTEFKEITYGLQRTNASTLLRSCLEYVMNYYHRFLPGEGGYLLDLLQSIYEYSQQMDDSVEKEISSDVTLKIIDMILVNETSFNKASQVKKLQELVQLMTINRESTSFVLPVSSSVVSNPKSISSSAASISPMRQLKSLQIFKTNVKTLPFSYQIYGDQLFANQLWLIIDGSSTTLAEAASNGTLTISVVTYRNLTYYLPKMYFSRNSYGTDINYIPASKIISSWLSFTNHTSKTNYLNLSPNSARVEIIFQHEHTPNNEWIPLCGYDSKATYEPSWRTDVCMTENLMENLTRCMCPISGTFVVLHVKKSFNVSPVKPPSVPMIVVICCGCCFLQATIAFVILLPNIYIRRCYISINFAIMQFCLSITAMMTFIILGLLKFLPQEWYGLLSSSFAAVLLLSSSTLIAIVLIIQSELEIETSTFYASMAKLSNDSGGGKNSIKKMSIKTNTTTTSPTSESNSECMTDHVHIASGDTMQQLQLKKQQRTAAAKFNNLSSTNRGVKSAIGLSWLLPLLCALCIPMIHKIMGHRSNEWWLEINSSDFIIFAITEMLLVSLFILLFVTLLKHLIYLAKKYEKANTTLKKRISLLNRIAVLFVINFLSHTFYLMYLNTRENIFCYMFSITSILLGLMIILCFIIKVDYAVNETTSSSTKSSMKNSLDDFCTTTINNSLNYYQDMEKDNKSVPMRVFSNTMSNYTIDMKCANATTSMQTSHLHSIQSRLTDKQMCPNEIIDLTSSVHSAPMVNVVGTANLTAQARSYELQKLNANMMNIYDINNPSMVKTFVDLPPSATKMNNANNLDILKGISKDSIVGIRENSLELKSTPIITVTNSDGKRACENLLSDSVVSDPNGMLNLISNDLDYLLNRTQEVPLEHMHQQLPTITPPPPASFASQAVKSPPATLLQHEVIIEESEHEVDS